MEEANFLYGCRYCYVIARTRVCALVGPGVHTHIHKQMPEPKTAKETKASKRQIPMVFAKIRFFYFIKQTHSAHTPSHRQQLESKPSRVDYPLSSLTQSTKWLSRTLIKRLWQLVKEPEELGSKAVTKESKSHWYPFNTIFPVSESPLRRSLRNTWLAPLTLRNATTGNVKFIIRVSTTSFQCTIKRLVTTWLAEVTDWAGLVKLSSRTGGWWGSPPRYAASTGARPRRSHALTWPAAATGSGPCAPAGWRPSDSGARLRKWLAQEASLGADQGEAGEPHASASYLKPFL